MTPAVLLLGGPTGSGKTEIALELAQILDAEIISADARQIYRYLDIGTAKPTAAEQGLVPHHLIDLCEPEERYSAARFARDAAAVLRDLCGRGRQAIVVGGTGFYFSALTSGLVEAPETSPMTRERVTRLYEDAGIAGLREFLAKNDPATLAEIDAANPARLRRAVEYHIQTGGSLAVDRSAPITAAAQFRWYPVTLARPRAVLEARLRERLERMLRAGWLDEVEQLADRFDFGLPAFQAVGYRELYHVVKQDVSISVATEDIFIRTRRYAKRQATWFRHQGAFQEVGLESGLTAKIASGFRHFAENKSA